jgi:hypothetical protein
VLLFISGRTLPTKIEAKLTNNYAFSNIAVKFCETFTCPTYKQHDIKKTGGFKF